MNLPASFEQYVAKNFRFNFTVNLFDVAFYMFGYSFLSPTTILPIFVSHFTRNPIWLGFIPFLTTAGFLIPQLFSSNLVERAPIKKIYPFNFGLFFERLPIFALLAVTYLFAENSPRLTLVLFFGIFAWYTMGAGFLMVGWQDMIAKIIPLEKRGRFFGLSNFIGNLTGIAGATAVSWMLAAYTFPMGYVLAFTCASVCIFISWVFLGLSREPRDPVRKPQVSNLDYFRSLPAVIRSQPNFRNFLLTQVVSAFGSMGSGFLMIYILQHWNIQDSMAASFTIAVLIGQSVSNLAFGFLADRKGHKVVLEIAIVLNILAFILAIFAKVPFWFYAVFALRGMNMGGNFVAGMAFPLEFSEPKDRPTYIGLAGTVPGVAGAIAPILAGVLAVSIGYTWLFWISIIFSLSSLCLMAFLVRDPRHHPTLSDIPLPDRG